MLKPDEIVVVDGRGFLLSNGLGDVEEGGRLGLFRDDTRHLSRYRLTLGGAALFPLAAVQDAPEQVTFYATNPALPGVPAGVLSVERQRHLNRHLAEEIRITNYGSEPAAATLRFELGADFADVLELRSVPEAKLGILPVTPPAAWHQAFAYRRGSFCCQTLVRWSGPAGLARGRTEVLVRIAPGETWQCRLLVTMVRGEEADAHLDPVAGVKGGIPPTSRAELLVAGTPPARTSESAAASGASPFRPAAELTRERALADLRTLRLELPSGETIVGAGLPYFMTLFGRDSLLTAYSLLALQPDLAANVLRALARFQGRQDNPANDEEPGKILHEVRQGELALLGDLPHRCYYGSVDATPLFLVLYAEYLRQTGDRALGEELWPAAEAALAWLDTHGDRDGDGFVEYQRRAPGGLLNQGWKDSHDSVAFADGRLATGPVALCEVQGYVFDARLRMADLYAARGDIERAGAQRARALDLQRRFTEAFWLAGEGTFALALDGEKRPVDAVTSNAGHCLWSGIASPAQAARLADRLLAPDLCSGWGLRTLSTRMSRYNPISYHNGSVWPHDTVLVAAGLRRYGFAEAAGRLLSGLLDAAAYFPGQRLPELFAGYPRTPNGRPVPYPDANAPQAWAAAATLLAIDLLGQLEQGTGLEAGALVA